MGSMIEFARPDGGKTKGYLASAGNGRPGLVVIQEWWGLNDQICGVADRFARAGYNALAPDLYKGRVVTTPDEANHLMTGLDFPDATHQDLRGAAQHLKGTSGKLGVMGFCMGGALKGAGAAHEIFRYDAAHAFFNERSAAYDLASANQAWERTAAFLAKHL
jgi:carboxymethylenebutenolidase